MEVKIYTILLVEDDTSILKLLEYILKKDYNVLLAENGLSAYTLIKEKTPDLIISDIMMPEMDGFELKEEINKNPDMEKIPFIFLTAISDQATKNRAIELGVKSYIVKPVRPVEIRELVQQILS